MKNYPVFKSTHKAFRYAILSLLLLANLTGFFYWFIDSYAEQHVFEEMLHLPDNEVGLVLGTSKKLSNGQPNPYFYYRIQAAANLYRAGKVKYVLVSGDNNTIHYNEPRDMKKALIAMGVPSKAIYMDFAGFRTLDSVIRCKKIFGQNRFTIISQEFHNKRAIYISHMAGIKTVAYNAKDVNLSGGLKVKIREMLARVKAFLDVHILHEQPKFLGKSIQIGSV